ncbi:MAG: DUF5683 domain-containing protein [Bacteroidales bacterium]|jgi:hypothetical protein|nr:DUF5683 domain-containing protein [Bacteroidales bacterium]
MKRILSLLFFLLICISCVHAQQNDSVSIQSQEEPITTDTIVDKKNKEHSPKKAGWMSAALPGLGQAYNKKYWKIPIVYAGFAGTSIGIYYFHSRYKIYRDEYRNRLNEKTDLLNPDLANMGSDNINAVKQTQQRNMELFIIVTVVWYFFNVLDAVVDAHLMSFNISDDLSLYVAPSIGFDSHLAMGSKPLTTRITLTFKF